MQTYHLSIALTCTALAACATTTDLPANVTVTPGASYMERVDFSYARPGADFSRLKLCVAQNVRSDQLTLQDSAGSFVGRYTGTYYQANSRQVVGGGQVFKYVDDAATTAIANGVVAATPTGGGLVRDFVRYELKAELSRDRVGLLFTQIARAQQSTGSLANDGFQPVGTWAGARADGVYAALQTVASGIKGCLQ